MKKFSKKDLSTKIVAYIVLFGGGIVMIYPLIYCFMASLLTLDEYLVSGLLPMPGDLSIERFANLLGFSTIPTYCRR